MPRGSHMTQRYGGLEGGFAESIRAFAEQAEQALDATFREIVIEIGSSVIRMSPVGNPEAVGGQRSTPDQGHQGSR